MTLFHYYSYYKSLREYDRAEISVACVFLAAKIDYFFITIEDAVTLFNKIKSNTKPSSVLPPDFIKFEIEIMNFLGFDIEIKTPYQYLQLYISELDKIKIIKNKNDIERLSIKIIQDSYRKPLCIFLHPRYISLVSIFLSLQLSGYEDGFYDVLNIDKNIKHVDFMICLEHITKLYEQKMELIEKKENKSV